MMEKMEKHLIDRDALIYAIRYELFDWNTVDGINSKTVLKQLCRDIMNQPVIDDKKECCSNDNEIHDCPEICKLCEKSRTVVDDVLYYCVDKNRQVSWYDCCSKFVKGVKK